MINNITLVGNLTKDVEIKKVSDKDLGTFSIAVNRDKDTTYFFDCYTWGDLALTISKYFKKGSKIAINGELIQQVYENKEHKKVSAYKIYVKNFEFTESRK